MKKRQSRRIKISDKSFNVLNEKEKEETILELFEVNKAIENEVFIALLESVFKFANIKTKDLNISERNTWYQFMSKISLYYRTPNYAKIYEIIKNRFANYNMSVVEIETPASFILGYDICEGDRMNFFFLDSCLLPPDFVADDNQLDINFIKLKKEENVVKIEFKKIQKGLDTHVFITSSDKFIGLNNRTILFLNENNIEKITLYKMNHYTKRFDIIYKNKDIKDIEIMFEPSETRDINSNYDSESGLFWPLLLLITFCIITVLFFIYYRKSKRILNQ